MPNLPLPIPEQSTESTPYYQAQSGWITYDEATAYFAQQGNTVTVNGQWADNTPSPAYNLDVEVEDDEDPVPEQMFFLGDRVLISNECLEDNGLSSAPFENVYGTVTNIENDADWNGNSRFYYDVRLDFPEYSAEMSETFEYVSGWEWQFTASPFPKIEMKKGKKRAGGFASFMKRIEGKEEVSV